MPQLKHQLILHPDTVGPLALDKPVTSDERRVGFSHILRQCRDIHDAEDALDALNETPVLVKKSNKALFTSFGAWR